MPLASIAAVALAWSLAAAPPAPVVVFCSPGSPGTTAEAQPTMDAFARALAAAAHLPGLSAVYHESDDAGAARIRRDGAVAVVSLPFFLEHEQDLGLRARLQPVPKGRGAMERWALVAKKGRVTSPAALERFSVVSTAGFAPAFVRGPALGSFGPLPSTTRVTASAAVLSALRRAASGEDVAVLLDGAQSAALPSLPFAAELEVVARSEPLPVALVATVDARMAPGAWRRLDAGLRALPSSEAGRAALEAVQLEGFTNLDERAVAAARKRYREALP